MSEKIDDYGFTGEIDNTGMKPDNRLQKLENLILPLLQNLIDSAPNKIDWPNRKEKLEALVVEIKEITRS